MLENRGQKITKYKIHRVPGVLGGPASPRVLEGPGVTRAYEQSKIKMVMLILENGFELFVVAVFAFNCSNLLLHVWSFNVYNKKRLKGLGHNLKD